MAALVLDHLVAELLLNGEPQHGEKFMLKLNRAICSRHLRTRTAIFL